MTDLQQLKTDSIYEDLKRREKKKWKKEEKNLNSKEWQEKCNELFIEAQKKSGELK